MKSECSTRSPTNLLYTMRDQRTQLMMTEKYLGHRQELLACQVLQSAVRRSLKRIIFINILPWCPGAPVSAEQRMHEAPLSKKFGSLSSTSSADYRTYFPTFFLYEIDNPGIWRHSVCRTTKLCRRCGHKVDYGTANPHDREELLEGEDLSDVEDDSLDLWTRAAAARIQMAQRSWKARKTLQERRSAYLFKWRLQSSFIIAGAWRSHVSRQHFFRVKAMKAYYQFVFRKGLKIQRVWRGHLVRLHYRYMRSQIKRNEAAPYIQAGVRRAVARARFLKWVALKDQMPKFGVAYDDKILFNSPWELQLPDPTQKKLRELPLAAYAVWPLPKHVPMSGDYLLVAALNSKLDKGKDVIPMRGSDLVAAAHNLKMPKKKNPRVRKDDSSDTIDRASSPGSNPEQRHSGIDRLFWKDLGEKSAVSLASMSSRRTSLRTPLTLDKLVTELSKHPHTSRSLDLSANRNQTDSARRSWPDKLASPKDKRGRPHLAWPPAAPAQLPDIYQAATQRTMQRLGYGPDVSPGGSRGQDQSPRGLTHVKDIRVRHVPAPRPAAQPPSPARTNPSRRGPRREDDAERSS